MNCRSSHIAFLLLAAISITGCSTMNHTERGALLGSGIGAATGAIIGHQSGNRDTGALVGALAGGLFGGLAGNAEDAREERDAAQARANYANRQRRFAQRAVTNADVVRMTQSGISDAVIIGSIRNRGGRLDLSPQAIIALKQQGVGDAVIQFAQQNGRAAESVQPANYSVAPVRRAPTFYIAPVARAPVIVHRPPVVFGPRIHIHGRFGSRRHHHHHCW